VTVVLVSLFVPGVEAHPVRRVTARSICHYEENYYVWRPNRPWRVWGKVKPGHRGQRVVLQRSKRGTSWTKWKANQIQRYGRYSFKGTAPKKGAKWHVLLRVVFKRQDQHERKVSRVLYIDENPATRCE
jgi:hypothetical protein